MKRLVIACLVIASTAYSVTFKDILREASRGNVQESYLPRSYRDAVDLARRVVRDLEAGLVWSIRGPSGEVELKGGVLYRGRVVGVIRFDPRNLEVLPMGFRARTYRVNINYREALRRLKRIVRDLEVLKGVEYLEPERCWTVPVVYREKIVFRLKIDERGRRVVPNYKEEDEMRALGRGR